jgi:hypothetical protein
MICVAAVNEYEIYINGILTCKSTGWRKPSVYDITGYIKDGINLIAAKVTNNTPVQGKNMLETEQLNPDTLTSLILEGYIETENCKIEIETDNTWITCSAFNQGWESLELDAEENAVNINVKEISFPWGIENREKWIYAWERGTPPIKPWGRLPLFDSDVVFPVNIRYELNLPVGTKLLYLPSVSGKFLSRLDGEIIAENEWGKGFIEIKDKDKIHVLVIDIQATGFEDGLTEPLRVLMTKTGSICGDWQERGLDFYSGHMLYEKVIDIKKAINTDRFVLDLGKVNFHAEVWINGIKVGVKIWKPYRYDITDFIINGENSISIVISNLVANKMRGNLLDEGYAMGWNRYWYEDNIDRDSQNLRSGLFGPVKLIKTSTND